MAKKIAEFLLAYCFGVFISLFVACELAILAGARSGDKGFDAAVLGALILLGIASFVVATVLSVFIGASSDLPPATSAGSAAIETDGARKSNELDGK